jgi:integrase
MRPQEVVEIWVPGIVKTDPACWVYHPRQHKTEHHERERVIFIGPRPQRALRPFLSTAGDRYVFSPRRAERERNAAKRAARRSPMTPSQRARKRKPRMTGAPRECYTVASYRRAIRRACMKSGIPPWHPHQLRHTAGTMVRERYGIEASQAVLGHSELSTTQVYAEKDLNLARRVMAEAG